MPEAYVYIYLDEGPVPAGVLETIGSGRGAAARFRDAEGEEAIGDHRQGCAGVSWCTIERPVWRRLGRRYA